MDHQPSQSDWITRMLHQLVVAFALIVLTILIWLNLTRSGAHAMEVHFNPYALLSVASFVSNIGALFMVFRVRQRSNTMMWFALFLLSLMSWASSETFLRLSATPEAAAFWAPISTIGSVLMPVALYMFTLSYTHPKRALSPLVFPVLLSVTVMFIFVDATTSIFDNYRASAMILRPWGYVPPTDSAYVILTLWIILLCAASLALFYRYRQTTTQVLLRKQVDIFMIAIAIPLTIGTVTDGLLPALHIYKVPALTVMLLTLMGVLISYGIVRYRFFSFTPESIANEILSTMKEAVIGVEPDFRIGYVNPGAEQMFGMMAADLAGKRLYDYLVNVDDVALRSQAEQIRAGIPFVAIESLDFKNARGDVFTATLSASKLPGGGQYIVVMTDITALASTTAEVEKQVAERTQELHEEQAKLRASIDGLTLGFLLIDEHAKIVIQNKALRTILGSTVPIASTHKLETHFVGLELSKKIHEVISSGKSVRIDTVTRDGQILQVFIGPVTVQEAKHGAVIGVVVLIEDVTEEKVLERSKDEFFSIASHELRTPLTSIKGNTSMMLEYYAKIIGQDDSLKEMVTDIYDSSTRLIDIVRDFLDVSRVEQGKMVFRNQAVAIDSIVESIFYEMRAVANDKGIYLKTNTKTLDVLPKVWADKDRLSQVMYNLIGNAAKFTDTGGITVEAMVDDKFVTLTVTDTGRGISIENQKLLFHKFQQAGDSLLTRDATRGTGLGLYISRLMMENMGGSVGLARSTEGEGATFFMRVPIATKAQLASTDSEQTVTEKIDSSTGLSK